MSSAAGALSSWRLSLATRLVLLFTASTGAVLLVVGLSLTWLLSAQLAARDREEFDGKTELVQHLLHELGSGARIEAEVARFAALRIGHSHLQLGMRNAARWLIYPEPSVRTLVERADGRIPFSPSHTELGIGTDTWWLRRIEFTTPDAGTYTLYVGQHVSATRQLLERLGGAMAAAGLLGLLLSAALGWWVARRGLAPIAAIAAAAERVTADRLGLPLPLGDAPAELRGLVHSINLMLERLRRSFVALEQFSADLAHELRTPLNNLRLTTEVTLSRPRSADDYRDALLSDLEELDRLQRMVSDMLFVARAAEGIIELNRERVDLAAETRGLADFFEAAASDRRQVIEIEGVAVACCDRQMARRAITNLLSNAVRYAPDGATIRVNLATDADAVRLTVENPAEQLGREELDRLFTRFARGSAAQRARDGSGLGLPIAESIMRLHGGSIMADSSATSLRFTLVFPLPAQDRSSEPLATDQT